MKKLLVSLSALLICLSCFAACKDNSVPSDLQFTISDDGTYAEVTYCNGQATEVVIPDTYEGLPVTSIGERAFYSCSFLTSVTIPESVTSIGNNAFEACNSLTSITIPESVTSIGQYAFYGSDLMSVTIPEDIEIISEGTFLGCDRLTSVTIPDSVTSIGNKAFESCYSLTSVHIPDGVTSIGDEAFRSCESLKSIIIPDGVTSIGKNTFYDCKILTSVTIPDNVTSIGKNAFRSCEILTSVTIGNGVTNIGDTAFYGCYKLVEVINYSSLNIEAGSDAYGYIAYYAKEIHNGVSKVVYKDDFIFYTYNGVNYLLGYLGNAAEIILPESYNGQSYEIYKYAFYDRCYGLRSVTIPVSVTGIGEKAFFCWGGTLTNINYGGTKSQWDAIIKGAEWNFNTIDRTITCIDGTLSE